MQPEDLQKMTKEELVEKLQELNIEEEQTVAGMVEIRNELLARLEEEHKDGELVGEYNITKAVRLNIKTSMDKARELGATKTEETLDKTKLTKLYKSGAKVEGITETVYLSVRRISQEEGEK